MYSNTAAVLALKHFTDTSHTAIFQVIIM